MKISMNLFQRPDNDIWYVRLSSRRRVSLHTKDKKEAQRLFNELKRKWLAGKLAYLENRPPEKTLTEFLAEYGEYVCRTKSRATWQAYELALNKLIAYMAPETPLANISRKDIDTFLSRLPVKKTSANAYLRCLKAAFSQAVAWGYLKTSPCAGVKEYRVQEAAPRYLSPDEISRLLTAETKPRFLALWKFLLLTGCRRGEALQIQAKDINWQQRTITISRTKTGRAKLIRITRALEPILQALPQVGRLWPWTGTWASIRFARTAKKAGLTCRLHDLRHTFASTLVMAGVDLYTVKELLGHNKITTTQIYGHLSANHLDEALTKLSIHETRDQTATK